MDVELEQQTDDTAAVPDEGAAGSSLVEQGRKIDYAGDARKLMDRVLADARSNTARLDRDRQDWLNLKFERGGADNQWVVWDQGTTRFVRRGTDPAKGGIPEGVPRVVSNVFANKINGITSILDQAQPAQVWAPATDDDEDRATAEVIEDVIPVLFDEIDYRPGGLRTRIHKSIALTDKVGVCVWYDTDEKYGMDAIPLFECQDCQCVSSPMEIEDAGDVCPECESPNLGPAVDGMGVPAHTMYPKGKMRARLYESFEISTPRSARSVDSRDVPWVLGHSRYSEADALREFGTNAAAKSAIKDAQGSSSRLSGVQRQYADAMRQLSSPRVTGADTITGSSGRELDGPVIYILWHDPIVDGEVYLPHGLYAVDINSTIVDPGPLPVRDDDGCPFKNILLRTYQHQAGSGFGKPPADDLQPLQVSRNTTESLIQLILMHDAAPRTFVPLSVTLEDEITGMPGETIRYRSHMPGEKPQSDRGINPPEGLYKYLEMIDGKFDELSNLNAVLQGARPDGDPTAYEIETLKERGMSAFRAPLDQLIRFEMDLSRLLLWTAKASAWSSRFRKVRGENGSWEVRQFSASNLTGKVDVQIDPVTAWPKSPMMQLARFEKALAMGVLPPPATDPELQAKSLTLLDLNEMRPSMDVDRKQVARELDRWKAAQLPEQITPPDPLVINVEMHLFLKAMFLKTEEAEELAQANPPVYEAMRMHVAHLQQVVAERQAAAAALQNPAPPDKRTGVEKGETDALDGALESGALKPAGASGGGVNDAVEAGALIPAGVSAARQPAGPSIDDLMQAGAMAPAQQPPRPGAR